MKKGVSVILLLIFFSQTFYTTGLNLWFYLNQSHIVDIYCVNKAKPKLQCNGHCYLGKQMEKAEKETQEKADSLFKQWLFCKISIPVYSPCLACKISVQKNYLPFKISFYKNLSEFGLLRPPILG